MAITLFGTRLRKSDTPIDPDLQLIVRYERAIVEAFHQRRQFRAQVVDGNADDADLAEVEAHARRYGNALRANLRERRTQP